MLYAGFCLPQAAGQSYVCAQPRGYFCNQWVRFVPPPAPTFTIGTVTTLPAGSRATASITGTSPNFVLNLGIPVGNAGTNGIDGINGTNGLAATIAVGTVTTLPANSQVTVTNSGTEQAAVLNFGIPQGPAWQSPADPNFYGAVIKVAPVPTNPRESCVYPDGSLAACIGIDPTTNSFYCLLSSGESCW